MPLSPGSDRATISANISEMVHSGYPQRQAVAASLSNARRHPHAAIGGGIGHASLADPLSHLATPHAVHVPEIKSGIGAGASGGGMHHTPAMSPSQGTPWWTRSEARQVSRPGFAEGGGIGQDFADAGGNIGQAGMKAYADFLSGNLDPYQYRPLVKALTVHGPASALEAMTAQRLMGNAKTPPGYDATSGAIVDDNGQHWYKTGGHVKRDMGGMSMSTDSPWWERSEARQIEDIPHGGGVINSGVAGRTDRLPLAVAADSHVIPADVVSGLGQGNTLAGAHILNAALKTGPYGAALPRGGRGRGPPSPPHPLAGFGAGAGIVGNPDSGGYAKGGADGGKSQILAAGGEYIVEPDDVRRAGGGDINKGHAALDRMIKKVREHTIKFLKHAPEPVK